MRAQNGGSLKAPAYLPTARGANDPDGIAEAERRAAGPLRRRRGLIVGTAGHVDHGKTALVRALTGIDTDRLPEEKERGITIDLGFAYLPAADGDVLGFVDVPGHERFVGTMVAGATGIDLVLLVVAADDGVMPQTREHLAIADLLGLRRGLVVLTKADLADAGRRGGGRGRDPGGAGRHGAGRGPILPVSTVTGEGVATLADRPRGRARRPGRARRAGRFRLAVDRSFVLAGAGTVVTGTVLSGAVAVGDRVVAEPRRARGARALDPCAEPAGRARPGGRSAARSTSPAVERGRRVARRRGARTRAARADRPDRRPRCACCRARPKPLRQWMPVRLHHGAADVAARLVLLAADGIAPGRDGYAQLVLERPIAAAAGDRFVLRDTSAQRTIGGGMLLDLRPPARKRRTPERLAQLDALALARPGPRRGAAAGPRPLHARPHGFLPRPRARRRGAPRRSRAGSAS